MSFGNSLILYVLSIFSSILSLIFKPIDILLNAIVPSYESISVYVINFFDYFRNTFLFVINWIHIPSEAISLIIGYITFKVSFYFGTLTYKLVLKWYHYIKG